MDDLIVEFLGNNKKTSDFQKFFYYFFFSLFYILWNSQAEIPILVPVDFAHENNVCYYLYSIN